MYADFLVIHRWCMIFCGQLGKKLPLKSFCRLMQITCFFYKQLFFSTQPQCCLTYSSWTELQMLLRYCLMHIRIIIPGHIIYLLHLCPCLGLGLFMSYLCDLFFIFSLISIVINHITSSKQNKYLHLYIFRISPTIFGC